MGDGTAATRTMAPRSGVAATLRYEGLDVLGGLNGETRRMTGLTVTNPGQAPMGVEIEDEATKALVSLVVAPGETRDVTVLAVTLTQYWNTAVPSGARWDGLNIRFREPA